MSILLTGGLGFIGSHTCVELLNNGYEVVVIDNLSNSKIEVKSQIEKITGKTFKFYKVDLLNIEDTRKVFAENKITDVIHFAGFKAFGESKEKPIKYFENNLISTINLLKVMQEFKVKNFIFSSSATVYGRAKEMPIREESRVGDVSNPYGRTKFFIEQMLMDVYDANKDLNIVILRYFNPIGAHESGLIGENPNDIPNNLMPFLTKVATKKLSKLQVFGNDYGTKDGTGVRDYIHVCDLADGHLKALIKANENCGLKIYNLGTGVGYSVLEIINAFEKANNVKINYEFAKRREGDIDICYASCDKAQKELNFKTKRELEDMCKSAYNFEIKDNK